MLCRFLPVPCLPRLLYFLRNESHPKKRGRYDLLAGDTEWNCLVAPISLRNGAAIRVCLLSPLSVSNSRNAPRLFTGSLGAVPTSRLLCRNPRYRRSPGDNLGDSKKPCRLCSLPLDCSDDSPLPQHRPYPLAVLRLLSRRSPACRVVRIDWTLTLKNRLI